MKFLIVLATLVYIAYDWASVKKNKNWPVSLSATYYLWPKWVFPSVMTLAGFSLLPVWLEATAGSSLQFLSFLSCISFIFVGCAPDFKNNRGEYNIHMIFAYLAAATALLCLMFVLNTWWIFLIFLVVNYLSDIKSFKEHYIYHIEDAIIISVLLSII
jgi:hypothetical protein